MRKTALITGIAGQDGKYLCKHLKGLNYNIYGIDTQNYSNSDLKEYGISQIHQVDISRIKTVGDIIADLKPDEIYNLAAVHRTEHQDKKLSLDSMESINAISVVNMLRACTSNIPNVRFFQAGSSEMFGNSFENDGMQRVDTPMNPITSYGKTKQMAYDAVIKYRKDYGLFACNGILYNHESPYRHERFVTTKIVKTAIKIKKGLEDKLELGDLSTGRDWGHAKDYVRAMHLILSHQQPSDWIISTGETRTIKQVCEYVFGKMNLDYKDYVFEQKGFARDEYNKIPCGDATVTNNILKWETHYSFYDMLDEMINYWNKGIG
tara:strand:+ start:748 stop:1710 length:963 start_codon:yes stop_codon:yes gene_type:complete